MIEPKAAAPAAPAPGLLPRLSVMMFLQYGIWGAWLPLLYPFLKKHRHFSDTEIGWMFSVGGLGALAGPWIAGQIADRWFATEKYLGLSHLVGAVLIWQLAWIEDIWAFLGFSLVYSLIYSPTMALTNSLSFAHLPDRDRDFGRVRVWGTLGWIAVGIGIGQWLKHSYGVGDAFAGMADAFRLSAILGAAMGFYCFFLPHTPPSKGLRSNAAMEALGEARRQPLLTLFLLAVPISMIHQFYFVHTANFLGGFQTRAETTINELFGVGGGGLMTIGQMSEVLVLALIPLVAKKLSRKTLLGVGIVAYAVRMALFAWVADIHGATGIPETALVITGVAMHGLCFGCFIFVAFMIVDERTTPDVKASAQNLFNLVFVGIGVIAGSFVATSVVGSWATRADKTLDYTRLFAVPMWASIACLVLLLIFYPGRRRTGT